MYSVWTCKYKLQIFSLLIVKKSSASYPPCTLSLGTCRACLIRSRSTPCYFLIDPLVADLYPALFHQMANCALRRILAQAKLSLITSGEDAWSSKGSCPQIPPSHWYALCILVDLDVSLLAAADIHLTIFLHFSNTKIKTVPGLYLPVASLRGSVRNIYHLSNKKHKVSTDFMTRPSPYLRSIWSSCRKIENTYTFIVAQKSAALIDIKEPPDTPHPS